MPVTEPASVLLEVSSDQRYNLCHCVKGKLTVKHHEANLTWTLSCRWNMEFLIIQKLWICWFYSYFLNNSCDIKPPWLYCYYAVMFWWTPRTCFSWLTNLGHKTTSYFKKSVCHFFHLNVTCRRKPLIYFVHVFYFPKALALQFHAAVSSVCVSSTLNQQL